MLRFRFFLPYMAPMLVVIGWWWYTSRKKKEVVAPKKEEEGVVLGTLSSLCQVGNGTVESGSGTLKVKDIVGHGVVEESHIPIARAGMFGQSLLAETPGRVDTPSLAHHSSLSLYSDCGSSESSVFEMTDKLAVSHLLKADGEGVEKTEPRTITSQPLSDYEQVAEASESGLAAEQGMVTEEVEPPSPGDWVVAPAPSPLTEAARPEPETEGEVAMKTFPVPFLLNELQTAVTAEPILPPKVNSHTLPVEKDRTPRSRTQDPLSPETATISCHVPTIIAPPPMPEAEVALQEVGLRELLESGQLLDPAQEESEGPNPIVNSEVIYMVVQEVLLCQDVGEEGSGRPSEPSDCFLLTDRPQCTDKDLVKKNSQRTMEMVVEEGIGSSRLGSEQEILSPEATPFSLDRLQSKEDVTGTEDSGCSTSQSEDGVNSQDQLPTTGPSCAVPEREEDPTLILPISPGLEEQIHSPERKSEPSLGVGHQEVAFCRGETIKDTDHENGSHMADKTDADHPGELPLVVAVLSVGEEFDRKQSEQCNSCILANGTWCTMHGARDQAEQGNDLPANGTQHFLQEGLWSTGAAGEQVSQNSSLTPPIQEVVEDYSSSSRMGSEQRSPGPHYIPSSLDKPQAKEDVTGTEDSGCSTSQSESRVSSQDLLPTTGPSCAVPEREEDQTLVSPISPSQIHSPERKSEPSLERGHQEVALCRGETLKDTDHQNGSHMANETDADHPGGSEVNLTGSGDSGQWTSGTRDGQLTRPQNPEPVIWEIEVPKLLVGRLIGKRGRYVSLLKQTSGAKVYISPLSYTQEFQICHVEGSKQQVDKALGLIGKKFKDLDLTNLYVPPLPVKLPSLPITSWLLLPDGMTVEVAVVKILSASHMFIQQTKHPSYPALNALDQDMLLCYSQPAPVLPSPTEAGVICAAPGVNGAWWRAQVISFQKEYEKAAIRYVDYGGYETVKMDTLRQIRSDFVTLPFQGAEVVLNNVKPFPGDDGFSALATAALEEMTRGSSLLAQVTGYDDSGIPFIQMWKVVKEELVSVNRTLVDRGLATWLDSL